MGGWVPRPHAPHYCPGDLEDREEPNQLRQRRPLLIRHSQALLQSAVARACAAAFALAPLAPPLVPGAGLWWALNWAEIALPIPRHLPPCASAQVCDGREPGEVLL